jgi:hypothetical protein
MVRDAWKLSLALLGALGLLALPVGMTGCEEEGPAERAGEKLDRAGEDVEDAVEDLDDDKDIDIDVDRR